MEEESGDGEVEMGADEEEVKVPVVKDPILSSQEEIDRHNVSHIPYRGWCRHCIMGRGRSAPHMKLEAEKQHVIPTVGHDYGFIGRDDRPAMPMLVGKSFRTFWMSAAIVPAKGDASEYIIQVMTDFLLRPAQSGSSTSQTKRPRSGRSRTPRGRRSVTG